MLTSGTRCPPKTTTEGERVAAEHARSRILERLRRWEKEDPPVEYRFRMGDLWSRKVFLALLRRYEIQTATKLTNAPARHLPTLPPQPGSSAVIYGGGG
jgi:hypothetical protein